MGEKLIQKFCILIAQLFFLSDRGARSNDIQTWVYPHLLILYNHLHQSFKVPIIIVDCVWWLIRLMWWWVWLVVNWPSRSEIKPTAETCFFPRFFLFLSYFWSMQNTSNGLCILAIRGLLGNIVVDFLLFHEKWFHIIVDHFKIIPNYR